jgi:hypothetical protein
MTSSPTKWISPNYYPQAAQAKRAQTPFALAFECERLQVAAIEHKLKVDNTIDRGNFASASTI